MQLHPKDVLAQFPVRKTKAEKQAFRDSVVHYVVQFGYPFSIERGSFGCENLVIGNPNAKYLLSAGMTPSGVSAWLEILRTFPENQRQKACFVLFDGNLGASSFCKIHKPETGHQLLIHLEHVGDGRHLRFFPTKQLKCNRIQLTSLYKACGYFGSRDLLVEEKKKPFFLKTSTCFPYAVTICALQDHKKGLRYNAKSRKTALDESNVNILRAALTTLICCDEVN